MNFAEDKGHCVEIHIALSIRCGNRVGTDVVAAVDALARKVKKNQWSIGTLLVHIFPTLAKLNPQETVHTKTLYSVINMLRRVPPGPLFAELIKHPAFERHCKPTETTVPHISPVELKEYQVPRPSTETLNEFYEVSQKVWAMADGQEVSLRKSSELFNSLAQRAFSGEL